MAMNKYGYDLDDPDQTDEILYGWETIEEEHPISQSRWHTDYEKVVKSPLGVFFNISWTAGSTEQQECDPDYVMVEVEPKETVQTIYVVKGDK